MLTAAEKERASKTDFAGALRLEAQGIHLLLPEQLPETYVQSRTLSPALYAWGDSSCLNDPLIAIVGTRGASTYGKAAAQKFAESFARAGATVVSGGALGIDAAAHKGALAAGGKTVAVLLTSIERVYPRQHAGLFQQIKANGCLLSQFAVGVVSNREYRPLMRNQTVAGLSKAVVVVEAPERSGALSTASAANELGRQVFVVPSNIDNVNFRGSHALIRDGATLVDHPDQVLDAIGITPRSQAAALPVELSEIQQRIVGVLSAEPLSTEHIVNKTGLEPSVILSELTMLELEGVIHRDRGGYARKL